MRKEKMYKNCVKLNQCLYKSMGGINTTLSLSTTDITNDVVNKITSNLMKKCETNVHNEQQVKIKIMNSKYCDISIGNIGQTIDATIQSDCIQTEISKSELQTALNNSLDQYAETLRTCGSLALVETTISTNMVFLRNTINNEAVLNTIMESMQKNSNIQGSDIVLDNLVCSPTTTKDSMGNIITSAGKISLDNITQVIKANIVYKSLQSSDLLNSAVVAVDNEVKQIAKATALGVFDGIATAGGPIVAIVAIVIIGGCITGYFAYKKGMSGNSGMGEPMGKLSTWLPIIAMFIAAILIVVSSCMVEAAKGLEKDKEEKDKKNYTGATALYACGIVLLLLSLILYMYIRMYKSYQFTNVGTGGPIVQSTNSRPAQSNLRPTHRFYYLVGLWLCILITFGFSGGAMGYIISEKLKDSETIRKMAETQETASEGGSETPTPIDAV